MIVAERYTGNPILKPCTDRGERAVFNAAAGLHGGEFTLLFRVMNKLGYSSLGLATSKDGKFFTVKASSVIVPTLPEVSIEDPRMTFMDGYWHIQYSSFQPMKVVHLRTKDFVDYERLPDLFKSNTKNVCLLPKKVNDKYGWLYRFDSYKNWNTGEEKRFSMWYGESVNITNTLDDISHHLVLVPSPKSHAIWPEVKVGITGPPLLTKYGWLLFYHSCDSKRAYQLKIMLLDRDKPWIIKWRQEEPILQAKTQYERMGYDGWCEERDVVFSCGVVERDDQYWIYYGAADTTICLAWIRVSDVYEAIERSL